MPAAGRNINLEARCLEITGGENVSEPGNASAIGRLLEELSWEGSGIREYRDGGRGRENVLTAEVLMALNFLPRTTFLGAVLRAAHGAELARSRVIDEVEEAEIVLLPDETKLRPSAATYQQQLVVQPDGVLTSPKCHALVEAKRIRPSSFQPEQLAREYLALMREASGRTPLLLLILGTEPPVPVKGHGRLDIDEAVTRHLSSVLDRTEGHNLSLEWLREQLAGVCAWITWNELSQTVATQQEHLQLGDPSVAGTISRLVDSITGSIAWHA